MMRSKTEPGTPIAIAVTFSDLPDFVVDWSGEGLEDGRTYFAREGLGRSLVEEEEVKDGGSCGSQQTVMISHSLPCSAFFLAQPRQVP